MAATMSTAAIFSWPWLARTAAAPIAAVPINGIPMYPAAVAAKTAR
jgi:hypothetical protein